MEKTITIDGREVGFKATASIINRYRQKFNRDLFKDIQSIVPKVNNQTVGADDLECFMNIAYLMAWMYDNTIPSDPNEWLDQFEVFSIYMVLPQIIELLNLNAEQIEKPKKKAEQQSGK